VPLITFPKHGTKTKHFVVSYNYGCTYTGYDIMQYRTKIPLINILSVFFNS